MADEHHDELHERDRQLADVAARLDAVKAGNGHRFILKQHEESVGIVLLTAQRELGPDMAIEFDFVTEISGLTPAAAAGALERIGAVPCEVEDGPLVIPRDGEPVPAFWRLPPGIFEAWDAEYPAETLEPGYEPPPLDLPPEP